ncbi:MAG TPA: ArgP/LysG family DNA-binding transcriptional regulator, partial [Rhodocyclaceae bacterium]|nr:ArgP/LysG family DNA-binding transcriptional regulator [Rhodocyclaceae bacterium]
MIDHRLLAFEAVLQEGSFERAARRLALTQSAVSQRVKLLEAELGQVLLVRSKPVRPTPAGRRLLPYLAQLRLMEAEARRALAPRQAHGPLRLAVGVNADSLATWFIGAVAEVVRDEGIVLDCVVDDQDHTHALLADGEVLGCVSTRPDPMRGCAAERLGVMPYLCAAAPDFR